MKLEMVGKWALVGLVLAVVVGYIFRRVGGHGPAEYQAPDWADRREG